SSTNGQEAPEEGSNFTIYIASTPGQYTQLPGSMSLEHVNEKGSISRYLHDKGGH
ncbi:hypothetical protein AC249_AIPGENE18413, partial [Exaiptasia diaphana]